jgi:hypothetical protein
MGLEGFDKRLPFDIAQDVSIEDVSALIQANAFDGFRGRMGTDAVETLHYIRHALVHRYDPRTIIDRDTNEIIGEEQYSKQSEQLVRNLAACLRLIRPSS